MRSHSTFVGRVAFRAKRQDRTQSGPDHPFATAVGKGPGLRQAAAGRLPTLPFLAFLAVLIIALVPLRAAQTIDTDPGAQVDITLVQHLETTPPSGWIPVTIVINNRAPGERVWRVSFDNENNNASARLGEWTLPVPGNQSREFELFIPQPGLTSEGSYIMSRGSVSGPGVRNGALTLDRNFYGTGQSRFTGMSQLLAAENWSRLEAELSPPSTTGSGSTHGLRNDLDLAGARFDPARLPADWRTWSGFASVWLHRDDWIAMSGAQRIAVMRWVAQGGELYLAGEAAGLEDAIWSQSTRIPGTNITHTFYGLGLVCRVPLLPESTVAGPRLNVTDMAAVIRSTGYLSPSLAHLSSAFDPTGAEAIIGEIRPGGIMLGLVIAAIAILLGPVNIFLLAPARRRARLFVTVPLISLGGAVALVILILVQDGTGGHGNRGVLITLLPDRPEALVLQEQCAMTGLLLNRSFPFAAETTLIDTTNSEQENRYGGSASNRVPRDGLNRSGDEASGSWFTSRTVHSHHLRTFVPTRAALTLQRGDDESLSVISTCPGILRDVIVIDQEGTAWWAEEVAPGRSVPLATAGPAISTRWHEQLNRFGASLAPVAGREAQPLSFHAAADSWDESVPIPTLGSIKWRNDTILVTGQVREAKP